MYTYGHLKFQRANVYHVRLLATYINWSTLVRFAITNSCWKLQIKPLIVIKNGEKKTNSVHMQSSFSNQVRNIILKKITRKKYCRTTKCIDGCLAMHLPKAIHPSNLHDSQLSFPFHRHWFSSSSSSSFYREKVNSTTMCATCAMYLPNSIHTMGSSRNRENKNTSQSFNLLNAHFVLWKFAQK